VHKTQVRFSDRAGSPTQASGSLVDSLKS